ncbi:class I SAM-dependent methyltransferase [Corynebacterium flavescens]|uniref:Cyclopropane-fatty-acyl-phospholipid synthase n=1 Tax=Corynebacterium flavescens TaxID=28028 RepID=A0A1L7CLV4_CORFL|nr:class I SAM-dependent methyltransferase [Corynebacterium flavescens]APT86824.1 cyclopropane-fatty-acyl-phospholipid synthase [Corynebacterium flavescens]KAA8722022.1 SAM-dependent methyltransferase [Corynebacterium flavescens]GEB97135.1 cyclopropane-fatty-acyl-phospholipid synthase [Corynebacterium flavescens]
MSAHPFSHLESIDAQAWPNVATVPSGRFTKARVRLAEAEFAKACFAAGLDLDPHSKAPAGPDLIIEHDALFFRLADSGWLGLAESYMAGEWKTPDSTRLVKVLRALLEVHYAPRTRAIPVTDSSTGELPLDLVSFSAGDGLSQSGGIYASGVPTTVRESVENYRHKIGSREPKTHYVDVTQFSVPEAVDRDDLGDAQRRAADWLLDLSRTQPGTHLLVYPAAGLQAAIRATSRRATVDVLTSDVDQRAALQELLVLEGAQDAVHVETIDTPVPGPAQWRGHYDAIISVEKLEALSPRQRKAYVAGLDRLLGYEGRAVVQSTVATATLTAPARSAMQVLRAYIWPGLDFGETEDVHKLFDRHSGLRVTSQTHLGSHYLESLRQQRSFFEGHRREAAAAGFDRVFRRLWALQFALREALFELGMLDSVVFGATRRHRGGRR